MANMVNGKFSAKVLSELKDNKVVFEKFPIAKMVDNVEVIEKKDIFVLQIEATINGERIVTNSMEEHLRWLKSGKDYNARMEKFPKYDSSLAVCFFTEKVENGVRKADKGLEKAFSAMAKAVDGKSHITLESCIETVRGKEVPVWVATNEFGKYRFYFSENSYRYGCQAIWRKYRDESVKVAADELAKLRKIQKEFDGETVTIETADGKQEMDIFELDEYITDAKHEYKRMLDVLSDLEEQSTKAWKEVDDSIDLDELLAAYEKRAKRVSK